MLFIIYALLFVFFLVVSGFILALYSEQSEKQAVFGTLESVLFLVLMPKHDVKKDDQGAKEEKMLISQMEQVLANFLYLKKPKMFGQVPSVALEIASRTGGFGHFFLC